MHTPPKVPNLQLAINPQQQILRLDIPMNHMLRMEVTQRIGHLVDIPRAPLLREASMLGELLVQLALPRKLEHEEYPLLVVKVTVQTQDVRVSQVLLDLDLAPDLLLDARLHDLGFVETFERKDVLRLAFGPHHVHSSKLALAKWPANVKIGQTPFARWTNSEICVESFVDR